MPWGWLAALVVALVAALGGVAYLLQELEAQRLRAEGLRDDVAATMHELAAERTKRLEAERQVRAEQHRRLAVEGQLETLLSDLGLADVAGDGAPLTPDAEVAARLDEALAQARPPGEVIAELDAQLVRHAMLEFERRLAAEPDQARGRDYLHAALLARYGVGARERAAQLLDHALDAQPGLVEAYHQRASLALEAEQLDAAYRDTRIALEMQRNHWRAWTLLGRIEATRGNPDVAAEAYGRARAYAPDAYHAAIDAIESATHE